MNRFIVYFLIIFSIGLKSCADSEKSVDVKTEEARPNVLLIVLDDAGYSDLGAYGGEINTPNIDKLADEGNMFSQFHVTPNCSSTRASLLTGMDHHRTGMGTHVVLTENQKGKPGYEGYLNKNVRTLAEVMKDGGYHTMMAGKWHLGNRDASTWPSGRGFDESFVLLNGGGSHWDNSSIVPNKINTYVNNGQVVEDFPKDFYSSDYYASKIASYITNRKDEKPFFAYLSFTAPHNPLHAPEALIKKYENQYQEGWDQLQKDRLNQLKSKGLIDPSVQIQSRPEWISDWDSLNDQEKKLAARDMAIYAAMIDRLDHNVGLLVKKLKELSLYDNTVILVFSDNGPSKTTMLDYLELGGADASYMDNFDNELENRGLPQSNVDIGPGWAYGIAAPFRLMKGYQSQGGILSPLIIKPAKDSQIGASKIKAPVHVMDIMPTILEFAGLTYPSESNSGDKNNSQSAYLSMQGSSLIGLMKTNDATYFNERGFGAELFGIRAFRKGKWKIIKLPEPYGNGTWQLYDLEIDPGESNDLSSEYPEIKEQLATDWQNYAQQNGVIEPDKATLYSLPPKNH